MQNYQDTKFYKFIKPLVWLFIKVFYRPKVIGIKNIPKEGRIVLAGNHTKWLDPVMIVGVTKRQVHFLAKKELFKGPTKGIVKGMGCIPVDRQKHDKTVLKNTYKVLNNDLCIGIFPEGTINRTGNLVRYFKIGAVKACNDTNTKLVPFVITGKYKLFRRKIKIEFLEPLTISDNLEKENERLMQIISDKLLEDIINE